MRPIMRLGHSLRRRAPGAGARRRWRHLAVLFAVTVTSIAGYVALSVTVNGLPPYPSAGWVAVLQPATGPDVDVVQLLVQARTDGNQTRAAYDVVVCGPRPYTGDLLIGGSARLAAILPNPVMPDSLPPPRVERIPDLVFYFGGVINLGAVQLVHISLPDVSTCPATSGGLSPGILPGGSNEGIVGVTFGPVQQSWAAPWGWWHGPHASQAWPLTGAFPGVPPGVLGDFMAVSGLSGHWARPLQEYAQVRADDVPVSWSVDSATPAASGPYPLIWQSRNPVSPITQLTDRPSLALLQDLVVIFAVGLGIAGSMLASLLFEWLRPRPQQAAVGSRSQPPGTPAPVAGQAQPASPAAAPGTPGRWLALIGTVIVICYARSRLTRRKDTHCRRGLNELSQRLKEAPHSRRRSRGAWRR